MSIKITIGACSQAGVKANNEDSYGVMMPEVGQELTKGIAIAIADGMSQSSAAKEASETCVKCFLLDYYATPSSWTVKRSASQILNATNRWMCSQGQSRNGEDLSMVSTLSAMVLKSSSAHIFHIGDSRISLLRGGGLWNR